jgi:hypothetical protein
MTRHKVRYLFLSGVFILSMVAWSLPVPFGGEQETPVVEEEEAVY